MWSACARCPLALPVDQPAPLEDSPPLGSNDDRRRRHHNNPDLVSFVQDDNAILDRESQALQPEGFRSGAIRIDGISAPAPLVGGRPARAVGVVGLREVALTIVALHREADELLERAPRTR